MAYTAEDKAHLNQLAKTGMALQAAGDKLGALEVAKESLTYAKEHGAPSEDIGSLEFIVLSLSLATGSPIEDTTEEPQAFEIGQRVRSTASEEEREVDVSFMKRILIDQPHNEALKKDIGNHSNRPVSGDTGTIIAFDGMSYEVQWDRTIGPKGGQRSGDDTWWVLDDQIEALEEQAAA